MSLIIKNVKLIDSQESAAKDVLIEDGKIKQIGMNIKDEQSSVIEGDGRLLIPGMIDLHIHLREPGGEHKETIKTGTMAAARGGFTTIAAMPNTSPVPDNVNKLQRLFNKINENAQVRVLPYASISKDLKGNELTDIEALTEIGAFAFTDDGVGIQTSQMMFEAMKKASEVNKPIVAHCEDNSLIYSGVVHEGEVSRRLNLPGIPSVCESVQIARDVLLAEAADCHYHVCHVSTKESVRVIRDAKKAGIHVTAEVTPHHLLLNEQHIKTDDPNFKMNPPLRSKADQEALLEGLLDGTIDFIATDHAPHTEDEKSQGMLQAPFGIVGLETAFPLLYTYLVKENKMTLEELVDHLTINPARTFNLPFGTIEEGAVADITLIDLNKEIKVDKQSFYSKSINTPFDQWPISGIPELTIVNGDVVYDAKLSDLSEGQ